MGRFKNKYKGLSGKKVNCKCGRFFFLKHPANLKNNSGGIGVVTSHAHCDICHLEWHLDWGGRIYSHPYKPKDRENYPLDK